MGIVSYHKVPTSILPIISHKDGVLIATLWQFAHVRKDETGSVHMTKALTMMQLKSGLYRCHIKKVSKVATNLLNNCVECKQHSIKLNIVKISDKWARRGLWS
jgi:hypothetical protein